MSGSELDWIETAKSWVRHLTVSRPTTSDREWARESLENYFRKLKQTELLPAFLLLTDKASSRQQRILADLAARSLQPGDAWLALLKEHRRSYCRRLARVSLRLWSEPQISDALTQGILASLHDQDGDRLFWLQRLTLEVARERSTVPLRDIERLLFNKAKAQPGWRRTKSPLSAQVKGFHKALCEVMAPADAPLPAAVYLNDGLNDQQLPRPAEVSPIVTEDLPLPTENSTLPALSFWKRVLQRFLR